MNLVAMATPFGTLKIQIAYLDLLTICIRLSIGTDLDDLE